MWIYICRYAYNTKRFTSSLQRGTVNIVMHIKPYILLTYLTLCVLALSDTVDTYWRVHVARDRRRSSCFMVSRWSPTPTSCVQRCTLRVRLDTRRSWSPIRRLRGEREKDRRCVCVYTYVCVFVCVCVRVSTYACEKGSYFEIQGRKSTRKCVVVFDSISKQLM